MRKLILNFLKIKYKRNIHVVVIIKLMYLPYIIKMDGSLYIFCFISVKLKEFNMNSLKNKNVRVSNKLINGATTGSFNSLLNSDIKPINERVLFKKAPSSSCWKKGNP